MKAKILYKHRENFDDGAIMEVVIWRLPRPVSGSSHSFKYRLFYGYAGKRLIGYDNERGKGDHRHRGNEEFPFEFGTPETLIDIFLNEVSRLRRRT
jgi:hypothetical protein